MTEQSTSLIPCRQDLTTEQMTLIQRGISFLEEVEGDQRWGKYFERIHQQFEEGNLQRACQIALEALEEIPDQWQAWSAVSFFSFLLGLEEHGFEALEQALQRAPNHAYLYATRGYHRYRCLNDIDAALADLNHAIALDPELIVAYDYRANIKVNQGDLNGALADLNRALSINPADKNVRENRAIVK